MSAGDNFLCVLFVFCILALILKFGSVIGAHYADQDMKQQAVDAEKATWVFDQKTREYRFEWK